MELKINKQGDAVIVTATGRMDESNARVFEQQCIQLLEHGNNKVLADLGGLNHISSAGLRSVLMVSKKAADLGLKFLLCNLGGSVKEVFEVSGLSSWSFENGKWVDKG